MGALYLKGVAIWLWCGLVGVLVAFFAGHRAEPIELFKASSLVTGSLFASIVPLLITVSMVSDNLFVLMICTGLWIVVLCAVLVRCTLQLFSSGWFDIRRDNSNANVYSWSSGESSHISSPERRIGRWDET
jgi:hypothetical protein